ncbi:uncharacterized protein T551_00158 [Pneumocystis jirovecii RU7]|uniref:Mediator of RNA polymerase II transcription subunit 18 n=1 Tax=Pneumocystis jirovecii (strain RU7) TaxID=1408657 RepID=A0A0W4ZWC6_PNEJ7|nr:uncharacterized protein T551_00158 [Pneumocystis jirovecii RU7]KTW32673.1 hypothetical protein T551_00158 [Pneumocystis jirovecii RU7]
MQEVSLFAGISAYKKEKVMHVLTRLTGQKQSTFMEWYMVYVPPSGKQFVSAFSRKPSTESVRWDAQSENAGLTSDRPDLYLRLYTQLTKAEATAIASAIGSENGSIATCSLLIERQWTVVLIDAPEAGVKRPATSRLRLQSRVMHGNIFALLEELGYTFRFAYALHGIRYIYGYCVLTLAQPLHQQMMQTAQTATHEMKSLSVSSALSSCSVAAELATCSSNSVFSSSVPALVPVDRTDSWLLEATVNVENANDRVLMDEAVEELSRLRKILQGVCHLEPADDYRLR